MFIPQENPYLNKPDFSINNSIKTSWFKEFCKKIKQHFLSIFSSKQTNIPPSINGRVSKNKETSNKESLHFTPTDKSILKGLNLHLPEID